MAEKVIQVCDFCGGEKSLKVLFYDTTKVVCNTCQTISSTIWPAALAYIQKQVNFSINHRLTLLSLLKHNADPSYWGKEGMELRSEIIKAMEAE